MMPMVWMADMDSSDSTLGHFAGVEKKLLVTFGTGETASNNTENRKTKRFCVFFDGGDGSFMQRLVCDNAAGADVFAAEFELRLDEDEEGGIRLRCCDRGKEDFRKRDAGDIGNDEIAGFWDVVWSEFAGVALDVHHARMVLEFPGKLIDVDVDGVNAGCAMLQ